MKRVIDAQTAKFIDKYSIDNGVPSLVLMERAALSVAEKLYERIAGLVADSDKPIKIAAVCMSGNNGADGIAALRIVKEMLIQRGLKGSYFINVFELGSEEKATSEYIIQKEIAHKYDISFGKYCNEVSFSEYDIIVDAIFGIGLSRDIDESISVVIDKINESGAYVISVDIPSGISATSGKVMKNAVKADETVTFGFVKYGHLLYPGRKYTGVLSCREVGFLPCQADGGYYFTEDYKEYLHEREKRTNKGNYGKPLIIAGSKDMTGAAFMSAMAAYRAGSGVVTVLIHCDVDKYLKAVLPEAIVASYNDENVEVVAEEMVKKASVVVLGPGISTSETSTRLVKAVLRSTNVPLIMDADALNIAGKDKALLKNHNQTLIITPHVKEMERVSGYSIDRIIDDIVGCAKEFAKDNNLYCVIKDAVTVVASPEGRVYVSTTGNPGMATAGSGDVLTGVMAAVSDYRIEDTFIKTSLAVYLHGMAGDLAAKEKGEYSLMARDIIEALPLCIL